MRERDVQGYPGIGHDLFDSVHASQRPLLGRTGKQRVIPGKKALFRIIILPLTKRVYVRIRVIGCVRYNEHGRLFIGRYQMKLHKIFLILLAVSLVMLQGCSPGGTWFPKDGATIRKQTHMDKKHRNTSDDFWEMNQEIRNRKK